MVTAENLSTRAELATAWEAFRAAAAMLPDGACICVPAREGRDYLPDGAEWTYHEVAEWVERLRRRYAAAGYGAGHRIALLLDNRPDIVAHMLALNGLGACVLPVNPDYRRDDLRFLFGHSGTDLVVALEKRAPVVEDAIAGLTSRPVLARDESFGSDLPGPAREPSGEPVGRETEAALLCTSGTTGMPKGCVLANEYFFFAAERYLTAGGLMTVGFGEERLFNPLPLFYANSFSISNMAMIMSANCMIFPDRFHPGTWWRDLRDTNATIIHYLGIIPPVTLAAAPVPEERQNRVRFGVGAGIDPDQHRQFEERFGFPLIEVWGMSEVGIVTVANAEPRHLELRSIGRPLAGVEIGVIDDEGRQVGEGEEGELVLRRTGPNPRRGLLRAYHNDPDTTAEVWRDGWFHTGDIVRSGPDGHYVFVDRKKHMIRRSGQKIAAAEVELCITEHPAVCQVAVVAVPDELREEEVMACIVLQPDVEANEATADAITDWALERIAYFKTPGWLLFMSELPTTATQKLQKSAIFAKDQDPRQRPGCFDLRPRKRRR